MPSPLKSQQLEISVTQADIDRAITKNSSRCVVASAIARSIPDASRIQVDVQTVRFSVGGERYVYLTPYGVAGYIVAFDAGDKIHPFRFRLRQDQEVKVRQRNRTEAGKQRLRTRKNEKTAQQRLELAAEQLNEKLTDPDAPSPSPAELKQFRAKVKAAQGDVRKAREEREAVMAAYEGEKDFEPGDTSLPRPTPKVFKRSERVYGMRLLRINQQTAADA